MSSFKQKLKELLIDSTSLTNRSNIEKKFGIIFLKAYQRIKNKNKKESLFLNNTNSFSFKAKTPKYNRKFNYVSPNRNILKNKNILYINKTLREFQNESAKGEILFLNKSKQMGKYYSKKKYYIYNSPKNNFNLSNFNSHKYYSDNFPIKSRHNFLKQSNCIVKSNYKSSFLVKNKFSKYF